MSKGSPGVKRGPKFWIGLRVCRRCGAQVPKTWRVAHLEAKHDVWRPTRQEIEECYGEMGSKGKSERRQAC